MPRIRTGCTQLVRGVLLGEATNKQNWTRCLGFLRGVLYDEAFHELPDDAANRQDARSWCWACFSMRPPPDRIGQDACSS
jgi:hypothetical protein